MAAHHHPGTSPAGMHLSHHNVHPQHPQVNGHIVAQVHQKITPAHLASLNESVWLGIANVHELQGDTNAAINAYEQAIRHNNYSVQALNAISCILRTKEDFPKAIEYLQAILKIDANNGEVWGSLGHCFLMIENLQEAYTAYQQALYHLRDPKEPKLWYGIGILYDRYGSLEHAEEAFSQVMEMAPDFEKANEIYFRLGIIYKQQQKYEQSLGCFKYIVQNPPRPLTEEDIWFQIGHVHEQQKDYEAAKNAYHRVLERNPRHAKVLQQLGWLYHQDSSHYSVQEKAIEFLEQSVGCDNTDAQSWYLLGRCYMSQQKYSKAYEAYQQAVYRDGRNPTFWCSIGVLYYQIHQYRDALDAYSRAIRLNAYISEVWYDLGTLYESCNNQTNDALDAYQRAYDLDPTNLNIKARLQYLRNNGQSTGMPNQDGPPVPQDVHPQQYQAPGVGAPPGGLHWAPPPASASQVAMGASAAPSTGSQDWRTRLADMQHQQPAQPAPQPPYERREPPRPAQTQRPLSPRVDQLRQYPEPGREAPARRPSPPPMAQPPPNSFHSAQALPQPQASAPPPPPNAPTRFPNPGYPGPDPGARFPGAGAPGASVPGVPYGRGHSPAPEIKPLADAKPTSPGATSGMPQYQHSIPSATSAGIAAGGPPPTAALAAAEAAAARERDEKPVTGTKRVLESDDEAQMPHKYPANGEYRSRFEDARHRRPSPPNHKTSPQQQRAVSPGSTSPRTKPASPTVQRNRGSSPARREEPNRLEEAHRPPIAAVAVAPAPAPAPRPAVQSEQAEAAPKVMTPATSEPRPEGDREAFEAAARKMDVDENYDEEGDEEKRKTGSGGGSPQRPAPAATEVATEA